jgi:SH3-like domain-containing protein
MISKRSCQVWHLSLAALVGMTICALVARAAAEPAVGPKSGLPVPRFVSLKPDRVNVRSMLSGRRTVVVNPKDKSQLIGLFDDGDGRGPAVARLQAGVLAQVKRCNGSWCRIIGSGFDGWIVQEQLWGVYPNEKVE